MSNFEPRVPGTAYAVLLLLILQHTQMATASPVFTARSDTATSRGGLSQPEKITLYVVAAVGGLFAILGVTICVLRTRHRKKCQNDSQNLTRSILRTMPIVQYNKGNESYPSTRTSSIDGLEDFTEEKLEKQRNSTCPICTEDFIENQMLRVLPCDHQYHMACIQDWVSRSSSCPVWYV